MTAMPTPDDFRADPAATALWALMALSSAERQDVVAAFNAAMDPHETGWRRLEYTPIPMPA